ncbi:hypothetical protein RSAG8_07223, partial [Rhizoctonia solani AG-8 WAC10335]
MNCSISNLKINKKGLITACNKALKQPTIGNLWMVVNYHESIAMVNQATGFNVGVETGTWTEKIKELYKELGAEFMGGKGKLAIINFALCYLVLPRV